jgi:hypothetical protein
MRQSLFPILVCAITVSLSSSIAQTPTPNDVLLRLTREVEAQQGQIAANQGKIEEKLSAIGESLRVARIFGARSN